VRESVVTTDSRGTVTLELRGTSDARSSVDRDTRHRIVLTAVRVARLWQLDDDLTSEENTAPCSRCDESGRWSDPLITTAPRWPGWRRWGIGAARVARGEVELRRPTRAATNERS